MVLKKAYQKEREVSGPLFSVYMAMEQDFKDRIDAGGVKNYAACSGEALVLTFLQMGALAEIGVEKLTGKSFARPSRN